MSFTKKYTDSFLKGAFNGCINNKTEVLSNEYCGCYNCLITSKSSEIREWISEPNEGEDTAACPHCTFDAILSSKYPIHDPVFLSEMHEFHFG